MTTNVRYQRGALGRPSPYRRYGSTGASIGLALRSQGIDVALADSSPSSVHLASDLGAGRPAHADDQPKIIVVCVPPDVTADVIEAELTAFPEAVVTDVASVKLSPFANSGSRC